MSNISDMVNEMLTVIGPSLNYNGLQGNNIASKLVAKLMQPLFDKEGIDMADWYVFGIGIMDYSDEYPEAINVVMVNYKNKNRLDFYFRADGSFHSVTVMDGTTVFPKLIDSIADAINHP